MLWCTERVSSALCCASNTALRIVVRRFSKSRKKHFRTLINSAVSYYLMQASRFACGHCSSGLRKKETVWMNENQTPNLGTWKYISMCYEYWSRRLEVNSSPQGPYQKAIWCTDLDTWVTVQGLWEITVLLYGTFVWSWATTISIVRNIWKLYKFFQ